MISKDKFLKNNIIVFFSAAVVNAANLLYQILIVKRLSAEDYGAFNSLLSTFMIISLPLGSLNTMVVKFSSAYNHIGERQKADYFLFVLFKHMLLIGLCFLAAYLPFGFSFKNWLHLTSVIPVYFTGIMLFLAILLIVPFAGLQGIERFTLLSANGIVSSLLKLSLGFLFLSLGWGLLGALGAYIASQIMTLAICIPVLSEIFSLRSEEPLELGLKEKYKFVIPSFLMLACIGILTNLDIILIKHFFKPIEAGYYSVAQLIGRIVLFVPGSIYIVMIPSASGLHAQRKNPRTILKRSLLYTAILCLSVTLIYNLAPEVILKILTGKVTSDIILLGRLFSVAMTFFSLMVVLLLYQLSVSKFRFLKYLILFSALQVIAILILHRSLSQVLAIMLINSIILFVLNLKTALKD